MAQGNRRIDRVLAPEFVSNLAQVPLDELRQRRHEAEQEETDLSYLRRLLQGRLDILRAELDARRGGRGTQRGLHALQEALADVGAAAHRGARAPVASRVASVSGRRRAERIVSDDHLARLPDLGSREIESVIDRATAEERRVSQDRKRLHAVIDALESELAGRYRAGLAPPV